MIPHILDEFREKNVQGSGYLQLKVKLIVTNTLSGLHIPPFLVQF